MSPRIGGLGETRTKATLITELRANLQLPVLDFGDPVKSFEHRTPKNIFSLTDAVPLGLPVVEDAPAAGDGAAVGVDEPPLVAPGATESAASAVLATRIAPTSAHYLALASVVLFLACLVATVLVVGASPGVLVATSTLALSPARATTWLGAAYGGAQEVATFMTVTAGTHRVAWTAGLLFAYWWLSTAYHGGALAALTYVCTQAVAAARRAPNRMRQLTRMLCIVALAAALNVAIGGVHGQPTETHIARTHGLYARLPSAGVRLHVDRLAAGRHNLAFLPAMLAPDDAVEIGKSMGFQPLLAATAAAVALGPTPLLINAPASAVPDLCMIDSGAGVDASRGDRFEVHGSRRPNTLAVSTANGVVVPPFKNDLLVPTRDRQGRLGKLRRRQEQ